MQWFWKRCKTTSVVHGCSWLCPHVTLTWRERIWHWHLLSKRWRSLAYAYHKILWGKRSKTKLILQFVIRWRWVFSFTLQPVYPREMSYCTHSTRGCMGSRSDLEVLEKSPVIQPRVYSLFQPLIRLRIHWLLRVNQWHYVRYITKEMEPRSVVFLSEHIVVKRHCRFYCDRCMLLPICHGVWH